jgi:hypothetical protein
LPREPIFVSEKILFAESVPAGRAIKCLIAIAFFSVITISALVLTSDPKFTFFYTVMFLFMVMFPTLLYLNFRVLNIDIPGSHIVLRFGIGNRLVIPICEVVECEQIKASFSRYGGAGIRLGMDGSRAYVLFFGDAVKVTNKEGKAFVFSTRKADKVCSLIDSLTSRNSRTEVGS